MHYHFDRKQTSKQMKMEQLTCKVKMAFNSFYLAVQKRRKRIHHMLCEALSCSCFAFSSFDSMSLLRDLFVSLYHGFFLPLFLLPPSFLFLKNALSSRMAMKTAVCALLLCMRVSVCVAKCRLSSFLSLYRSPLHNYTHGCAHKRKHYYTFSI